MFSSLLLIIARIGRGDCGSTFRFRAYSLPLLVNRRPVGLDEDLQEEAVFRLPRKADDVGWTPRGRKIR